MQRYTLKVEMFVWAEDDEQAKEIANKITQKQRKKFDNRCYINKLAESPFGRLTERLILGVS